MDKDLKLIYQKEEELRFLISKLPTMEEIVETTNSIIHNLENFKAYADEFLRLKKSVYGD